MHFTPSSSNLDHLKRRGETSEWPWLTRTRFHALLVVARHSGGRCTRYGFGGTRAIDSTVHRHARQVPRGQPAGVEIRRNRDAKCIQSQERASMAGCDTCFVTWISPLYTHYLVYPVASPDNPFPLFDAPLLPLPFLQCTCAWERERERDSSMPFEYLVHRASRPHASRPTLHCQPPLLLTNSCREPRDLGLSIFLVRGQGAFLVGHVVSGWTRIRFERWDWITSFYRKWLGLGSG